MNDLMHRIIDRLQMTFPPNRIVLVLMPFAASVAAWVSAFVAKNFPGTQLSEEAIIGFAAAAFLALLRAGFRFIDRWQEEERSSERLFEERTKKEIEAEDARRRRQKRAKS